MHTDEKGEAARADRLALDIRKESHNMRHSAKKRRQKIGCRPEKVPSEEKGGNMKVTQETPSQLRFKELHFEVDWEPSDEYLRLYHEQNSCLINSRNMQFEIVHGLSEVNTQFDE